MLLIVSIAVSLIASAAGFRWARSLTTRRLRYVDAAQSRLAPIIAGVVAAAVVMPITWIPIIGVIFSAGPAISLGVGVGLGVASARRDIRLAQYR